MTAKEMQKRGGRARAASLTAGQRSAIARKAARARWGKPKTKKRTLAA